MLKSCFAAALLSGAVVFAGEISSPLVRSAPLTAPLHAGQYSLGKWQNGHFLTPGPSDGWLLIQGADGSILKESGAEVPGAPGAKAQDLAMSKNGVLAVVGSGYSPHSALESGFLLLRGPGGNVEHLISTAPYHASRVCFVDDGTLWTAGNERTPGAADNPEADVLRHYDADGTLLHSEIAAKSFASGRYHPALNALLLCGEDRVGLYSVYANEWLEVTHEGELIGRWKGLPQQSLADKANIVLGGAYSREGAIYIQQEERSGADIQASFPVYRLNKEQGQWEQVSALPTEHSQLVGSDGDLFVMRSVQNRQATLDWLPQSLVER